MLERVIENYLVAHVEGLGGECIKFKPVLKGLPDRIVFLPNGKLCLVETKTAGRKPEPIQAGWQKRFRELGFNYELIDSKSAVDELIRRML